jgi:hypothetical protein
MISTGPHSIRATPLFIDLCQQYAQYYKKCVQEKIEEYSAVIAQQQDAKAVTSDHEAVVTARREVARAQVVHEALDILRSELERIYNFHYERLAEVWRQTRIELGLTCIEDDPSLMIALRLTMAMLKAENPTFREEKFIRYINS